MHPPGADAEEEEARPAGRERERDAITWRDFAPLLARLAVLEQQAPDLQAQIDAIGTHLAEQDAAAAAAQQQTKSQLGTVQQQLGVLVAEKAAAQEARDEQRKTARATFRTLLLALPTATWPLTEGHPFLLRVGIFGTCIGVALAFIAYDHFRAPSATTATTTTPPTR